MSSTFAELEQAIRTRCADDGVAPGTILQSLVALARLVSDRMPPLPPEYAASAAQAFSTLEACCRGASDEEPIVAALQALENSRRPVRKHQKVPPPTRFLELLAGVLDVAHYEDNDDWPDAVVAGAIELLGELGTPEAQAVQAVADVLARHGVI